MIVDNVCVWNTRLRAGAQVLSPVEAEMQRSRELRRVDDEVSSGERELFVLCYEWKLDRM